MLMFKSTALRALPPFSTFFFFFLLPFHTASMAALLGTQAPDNPRHKDSDNDNNILLSSFANVGLRVDKLKGFVKTQRGRSKKGKGGKKKPPQRGLGVAQLEKLRLMEEQAKREMEALRIAMLQGHYPVQSTRLSIQGFSPHNCEYFEQPKSFSFTPKPPVLDMKLQLGLSSETTSEETSLTSLCRGSTKPSVLPFKYRMPILGQCASPREEDHPFSCNINFPLMKQMCVTAPDEEGMVELSSFQSSNHNNVNSSPILDEMFQFKRRSCRHIYSTANSVRRDHDCPYNAKHANAALRTHCAFRKAYVELQESEKRCFYDFLSEGGHSSTNIAATVHHPDKEFLSLGLPIPDETYALSQDGGRKMDDVLRVLDLNWGVKKATPLNFLAKVGEKEDNLQLQMSGSSLVCLALGKDDEMSITTTISPTSIDSRTNIDLSLKL